VIQREVWATRKQASGVDHPETLGAAGNLAPTLFDQGKHDAAEVIQREVWATKKQVLGVDHPDTLCTAGNLAPTTLFKQGKLDAAVLMLQETVVAHQDHPNTISIAANLRVITTKREERDEYHKDRNHLVLLILAALGIFVAWYIA